MKVENINMQSGSRSVDVDNDTIKVENKFITVKLFINDKIQDIYFGIIGASHLTGVLLNW